MPEKFQIIDEITIYFIQSLICKQQIKLKLLFLA